MSMQDVEEQARNRTVKEMPPGEEQACVVGTLSEFYESQAIWGREISNEEREKMIASASRAKSVRQVNQIEHKLALAQAKKHRAENLESQKIVRFEGISGCSKIVVFRGTLLQVL